ncbi:hypothetical protein P5F77_17425 [Caldifermentibacillus hisashii]|uniref:hypothetical protein n=1 Tax=Caldifermentibacillus hisashii TaxID=996558 RepID=UPI0030D64A4A
MLVSNSLKFSKKLLVSLLAAVLIASTLFSAGVSATSSSKSTKAPGGTLTSNFWIQTFASGNSGDYQVSAVYNGSASLKSPNYIKTAWSFYAQGINASVSINGFGGSAGGGGVSSTSSGYWQNSNGAKTAWYRGNVVANGLWFYVGGSNTASMFALGVPASVTAGV